MQLYYTDILHKPIYMYFTFIGRQMHLIV